MVTLGIIFTVAIVCYLIPTICVVVCIREDEPHLFPFALLIFLAITGCILIIIENNLKESCYTDIITPLCVFFNLN